MKMNWTSVKAEHVTQACEELLSSGGLKLRPVGLIIKFRGKQLPAKAVLRLAYCLANKIDSKSTLKFASGEASLKLLQSLGFEAERMGVSAVAGKMGS